MPSTYTDNGGGAANGSKKIFTYTFPILKTEDVKVSLNGVTQATTKYTVDTTTNPTQIEFNNTSIDSALQESTGAPKSGVDVRIFRQTTVGKISGDDDPRVVFSQGSVIRSSDLNANTEQALYAIHELQDQPITQIGNVFTDAEKSKLAAIDNNSTDDQTASEIRTLVESATDSNVFTDADHLKLNQLSTDAILNSDLDGKGELLVGDGSGNPTALPVGTNGYVLKADSSEPTGVKWSLATANAPLSLNASNLNSGTIPNSVFPAILPAISGTNLTNLNASNLSSGTIPDSRFPATLPATSAANLTSIPAAQLTGALPAIDGSALTNLPGGTTYSAGSGLTLTGTTFSVNTLNQNTTGSAAKLTTPVNIASVAFDGSADISLDNSNITNGAGYIDGSALNATNLTSGTIPDARFPATLPAISGANLTNLPSADLSSLDASNLSSGTIPDARFPATLPAISGANLTNLPAGNLSNLNASNLTSGTIPDARFPATLPAVSGANLTNLPSADLTSLDATNLTSGTIPDARFPATLPAISGANLTNLPSGAGSLVGGSGEEIFVEVENTMDNSFSTTQGKNYIGLTSLAIASGVVFTVTDGTLVSFT